MTLSIIYINYNTRGLLKQSLKHLFLMQPALDFEIIVVDNASSDGSVEMLKDKYPNVRIIEAKENLGYAKGANLGIKASRGQYVAIFNPDIFISTSSLESAVNFLDNNLDAGVLGPRLNNPDGSLQYSCYKYPKLYTPIFRRSFLGGTRAGKKEIDRYLMKDFDHASAKEVDWLIGGALIARKKALVDVGLLDERYFLYFEDTDICRKLKDAGYKVVYYPASQMIHMHQRESAGNSSIKSLFNQKTREHIKSAFRYFWKYK